MILTYWIIAWILLVVGLIGTIVSVIGFYVNRGYDAENVHMAQVCTKVFLATFVFALFWPVVLPAMLLWGLYKTLRYKEDES